MKKIVINACYGGFGLSDEAMVRYCELKGITVYPEKEKDAWGHTSYYLKLPENRKKDSYDVLFDSDIKRDDPAWSPRRTRCARRVITRWNWWT